MKQYLRLLGRHGGGVSIVLLGAGVVCLFAEPVLSLHLKAPRGYNEGWNAYHGQRAFSGEPLYRPTDSLITNNYPPLSFLVVGAIGAATGDLIVAGRVVSLISLLSVAVLVGCIVNRLARDRLAAWVAALIFLGFVGTRYWKYVAMNDPQWLAHAAMMVGFLVFSKTPRSPGRLASSAVLMALAGFIKHNLIPLPAAAFVWMMVYERSSLRVWLPVAASSVIVGLAASYLAYGPDFIAGLLGTPRQYSLSLLVKNTFARVPPYFPLVALSVMFVYVERKRKIVLLVVLYVAFASIWGSFLGGGEGVSINALFDLIIALAILSGLTLSWISTRVRSPDFSLSPTFVWQCSVVLAAMSFVTQMPRTIRRATASFQARETRVEETRKDVELLASSPGPAACESLALCYWAGKGPWLDFFNSGQKLKLGAIPISRVVEPINSGYLSLIQLSDRDPMPHSVLLPAEANEAIQAGYQVVQTSSNGLILAPTQPVKISR